MQTIESTLREIARSPDDDVLRWQCAALYEQEGNRERARFIRLQLQIANLPDGIDHPDWLPMQAEAEHLLRRNYTVWSRPCEHLGVFFPRYDRGFIELVSIRVSDLLDAKLRAELFSQLPIRHLDILELNDWPLSAILQVPEMTRIVSVGLNRLGLTDHHIEVLARAEEAPFLPRLRWLLLAGNDLTLDGVDALASFWRKWFPSLDFVDLTGNRFDPRDAIHYDQHVILSWQRDEVDRLEEKHGPLPWLHPKITGGRLQSQDRLALARTESPTRA